MCIDVRSSKVNCTNAWKFREYMVYRKATFLNMCNQCKSNSWYNIRSHFSLLLHLAEIISHLELGSSLFLHLLDSHARCNLSKSETTVLAVDLEDTL